MKRFYLGLSTVWGEHKCSALLFVFAPTFFDIDRIVLSC